VPFRKTALQNSQPSNETGWKLISAVNRFGTLRIKVTVLKTKWADENPPV
jgi:hypothetical protein